MSRRNSSILKAVLIFTFICQIGWAQEVDEDFDALMNEPTNSADSAPTEDSALMEDSMLAEEGGSSLTLLNDDPKRTDFAMHGFSIGAVMNSLSYDTTIKVYNPSAPAQPRVSSTVEGSAIQSVGVVGRYSILPVDKVGTDINASYLTSINHDAVGLPSISAIKGELNLAYTFGLKKDVKLYAFAGGGMQYIMGSDINRVMKKFGSGAQAGAGINFQKINIDFLYSYYRNAIADDVNSTATATQAYDTGGSYVVTKGIVGRATLNF